MCVVRCPNLEECPLDKAHCLWSGYRQVRYVGTARQKALIRSGECVYVCAWAYVYVYVCVWVHVFTSASVSVFVRCSSADLVLLVASFYGQRRVKKTDRKHNVSSSFTMTATYWRSELLQKKQWTCYTPWTRGGILLTEDSLIIHFSTQQAMFFNLTCCMLLTNAHNNDKTQWRMEEKHE